MARKSRIHFPGAVYHVIVRGNCRQTIFLDDDDRYRFYLFLQAGTERFHHLIHAFCLMSNHVHLVIQVDDIPLSRIMQNLSLRFTRWINWRHGRVGHLFQGRYKSILVDADSHLLELVRYVHLNPVRAGIADLPASYPWSSHRAYLGKEILPWLTVDWALTVLTNHRSNAVDQFARFVNDGLGEGRKKEFHGEGTADSRIFGDDAFLEKIGRRGEELPVKISMDALLEVVCRHFHIVPAELTLPGKNRRLAHARAMAAWLVQDLSSLSLTELSRRSGRDISSLSAGAGRLRARVAAEPVLFQEKEELMAQIAICKT